MAKKKNKTKNQNWNKAVNRWVKNNQTLIALLGGFAGGSALTAAISSRQGQQLFSDLSDSVREMVPSITKQSDKKEGPASSSSK